MLAASPEPNAEDWAIHDYEGFEGANLSEYTSFETVCELADFIEENGELGGKVLSHFGDDLAELVLRVARDAATRPEGAPA